MKKGMSLVEALVVVGIASFFVVLAATPWKKESCKASFHACVDELYGVMQRTRMEAIAKNRYIGIKFLWDGTSLRYGIYLDGNHNGIRSSDIRRGVDTLLYPYQPLHFSEGKIFPGILREDLPDLTTGRPISNPNDPIKFGVSDICSFSPLGDSSPGTLYVTDGKDFQGALRLQGPLTNLRAYIFEPGKGWVLE